MKAEDFWDNIFSKGQEFSYSKIELPDLNDPILQNSLRYFGDINGKTLIDIGCGRGVTSLFFANHGANVISIDSSEVAIKNLSKFCTENYIKNITPIRLPAQKISVLGKADFVFGSMILHHIEPFKDFARNLRDSIYSEGKGFFWENNAKSKLLIWFRENFVGKYWIPKYGDPEESPLTQDEINHLKKYFTVKIEFPELIIFRLISSYILRGYCKKPFYILDKYFYRFKAIRGYSYYQYIYLS